MGSVAAWILRSGFLVGQHWRLYWAFRWGCKFVSMPEQGHRTVSKAGKHFGWGLQVRQNCPLSSLARQDHQQMGRTAGWHFHWGADVKKHAICQDLSTGCYKACPISLFLFDPQWSSPADFPNDLHEQRPKRASWKTSCNIGEAGYPPWVSFVPHWRNHRPQGVLLVSGTVSDWWGNALKMWHLLLPFYEYL